MAHPQGTPRGHIATQRLSIGTGNIQADSTGNMKLSAGLYLSGQTAEPVAQNSTGFLFPDQIRVDGARYIGANSTGFLITAETALPATDGGGYKLTLVVNSTGVAGLAINTTGTTWKYFKTTATINTT